MRVLVVEDDVPLAGTLCEGLTQAGFAPEALGSAEAAEAVLSCTHYDLVILDIGLPRMSGLELLRRLRERRIDVPILVLTARDGVIDRVEGLTSGADDYLAKPFHWQELVARCQALIRRSRSAASSVMQLGRLRMDIGRQEARVGDQPLNLTGREWDLLAQLMLAAPQVAIKDKLIDSLSRWDNEITANAIEIYVSRLRSKLQGAGVTLRTVRGMGYRLDPDGESEPCAG
jgi:DNA-binding response OmpR family regulator